MFHPLAVRSRIWCSRPVAKTPRPPSSVIDQDCVPSICIEAMRPRNNHDPSLWRSKWNSASSSVALALKPPLSTASTSRRCRRSSGIASRGDVRRATSSRTPDALQGAGATASHRRRVPSRCAGCRRELRSEKKAAHPFTLAVFIAISRTLEDGRIQSSHLRTNRILESEETTVYADRYGMGGTLVQYVPREARSEAIGLVLFCRMPTADSR